MHIATLAAGAGFSNLTLSAAADDGISKTAESIHQEVAIAAAPGRIYAALTDAAQFTRMTALSGMQGVRPAQIARAEGGIFSLFGGVIIGRHVEMVPGRRLVQAWRETVWAPGVYSLVKFDFRAQGGGTMIVFDHTGFPNGAAEHLAIGWGEHYWDPLKKLLT
jgi:uncharacterized protein YndB with AHSA1/START domain